MLIGTNQEKFKRGSTTLSRLNMWTLRHWLSSARQNSYQFDLFNLEFPKRRLIRHDMWSHLNCSNTELVSPAILNKTFEMPDIFVPFSFDFWVALGRSTNILLTMYPPLFPRITSFFPIISRCLCSNRWVHMHTYQTLYNFSWLCKVNGPSKSTTPKCCRSFRWWSHLIHPVKLSTKAIDATSSMCFCLKFESLKKNTPPLRTPASSVLLLSFLLLKPTFVL